MQFLFQYPEFVLAGVLSAALLVRHQNTVNSPIISLFLDIAKTLIYLTPERYLTWLQRNLSWSGWRSPGAFGVLCASKVYPALVLSLLSTILHPALSVPVAIFSFFIPDVVVASRRKSRRREIVTTLPQALDLMVLCIDAGLGIDSALHRVAGDHHSLGSALSDELSALNRDILLGMDRERAYEDLYQRSGVEELKSFGSALNQSSKLGLGIAQVVRSQSEFMRVRQHQQAEERAAKLSIYMVFPLWFCVMPALMVIVLAPSIILFFKTLAHFPPEWFM